MKKNKLIALALAGAVTFMGAGYAAWNDTVQINGTATTGNLQVVFEDLDVDDEQYKNVAYFVEYNKVTGEKIVSDNLGCIDEDDNQKFIIDAGNYKFSPAMNVTTSYDENGNTIDGRELPGLRIRTRMVNKGSIPAKFDCIEIQNLSDDETLFNHLMVERFVGVRVCGDNVEVSAPGESTWESVGLTHGDWRSSLEVKRNIIKYMKENEIKDYHLNGQELVNGVNALFNKVTLEVGEHVEIATYSDLLLTKEFAPRFRIYLNGQGENTTEGKTCQFTVDFNWVPFNQ